MAPISQITVKDLLTSSGKYPDRAALASTADLDNAHYLVEAVNLLFKQIAYRGRAVISSGFRPAAVNAATPGAAKRSLHMKCMAVDFEGQELGQAIRAHHDGAAELRRGRLFMESLESTPTWTHVDSGQRADRPNREFKP